MAAYSSGGCFEECRPPPPSSSAAGESPWSLLDLTAPLRSQVLLSVVGDLICYSGANEVNAHLDTIRGVCRELRDQIDEECLTFSYDDTCGLSSSVGSDLDEIRLLNCWIRRHPRLKYFECLLRSAPKFRALLQGMELPPGTRCNFVFEFKVGAEEVRQLFRRFRVRRLSVLPKEVREAAAAAGVAVEDAARKAAAASRAGRGSPAGSGDRSGLQDAGLHMLCLRSCSDDIARSFLAACPRLQGLQIVDSRLLSDPGIASGRFTSLSLTGVVMLPGEQFSRLVAGCQILRSLYISKCLIAEMSHLPEKVRELTGFVGRRGQHHRRSRQGFRHRFRGLGELGPFRRFHRARIHASCG